MNMDMQTELLILLENAMMSIINERIKRICVIQHFCNLGCGYYNYYIFYRCKILFKLNNYFSLLESCKLSFLLFSFPLWSPLPEETSKVHQILELNVTKTIKDSFNVLRILERYDRCSKHCSLQVCSKYQEDQNFLHP